MVKAKIYTRTGDNGTTSLITGKRVKKSDPIFEVLGSLDELNAALGFLSMSKMRDIKNTCAKIQNDLFILGSLVAGKEFDPTIKKHFEARIKEIESEIDTYESKNTPLRNFILPGGSEESCRLHLTRAISRRVERNFIRSLSLKKSSKLSSMQSYLNRISDLLFVMARYANKKKKIQDPIWRSI